MKFLPSVIRHLQMHKQLGDKTFEQLEENDFFLQPNEASNSLAMIIRHMAGNMLSRWTNFLTEDGEKEWRNRDTEFLNVPASKEQLLAKWEEGWSCVFKALKGLREKDLSKTIYIRSEPLSVMDAINRQLAHYPYHVGQIVYIGRMIRNNEWKNLSIPVGKSEEVNEQMRKKFG